jgi:hypothetical protein
MEAFHNDRAVKAKCCEECGGSFHGHRGRGRFCGLKCWGRFRSNNVTDPSWNFAHQEARRLKPPGPCENCGEQEKRTDVHHRDHNWKNNALDNLKRLCVSCHKLVHDRAKRCRVCGERQHARMLCNRHYLQMRKGASL